jgi:RES domain-containing protein
VIETSLQNGGLFYRAHTPQWASQPLSGAGAALRGGRFNRPGLHALYLADSPATALAEYHQLDSLLPPCTLVTYRVALSRLADLRAGYVPATWGPLWQEWSCEWRRLSVRDKIEPPSWVLGDEVVQAGCIGLLFPSMRSQGFNLVIYPDQLGTSDELVVHDPNAALPRDRRSWE